MTINWLLIFVPVAVALEHMAPHLHTWIFFSTCLAIIPIARLIVLATEQISTRTGEAVGGLLNATFGNAPELIITLVALKAGYADMVRGSLIGAILANLLLALGIGFLLGGFRYRDQKFNATAARAYSTMMLLAVTSLIVPSSFSRFFAPEGTVRQEQLLNVGIALVLLLAYALYLVFSLKTHPHAFTSLEQEAAHHDGPAWSLSQSVGALLGAGILAAWMSEILVGAAEGTGRALGMSQGFVGIVFLAIVGGAAESSSVIVTARKNKMDLSVGIALGSCIQIALFVAPVLVLTSYFIAPQPFELSFSRAEVGSLFLAVLIGSLVCGDGQSNWFKGVQLTTVYAIMALLFYFMPEALPQ
jgi:Ca2+:H+ antiporter